MSTIRASRRCRRMNNRGMRSLVAALLLVLAAAASAAYPEKPIRFIIPSAPGGSPDVLMRILTQQLSLQLNVPLVVENKPGGSYVLGTMDIVKAPPDGYTLGYGNIVSLAINRSLLPSLPYEVERDLTLISNVTHVFNLLVVNNDLPVRSVRELIDYAKKNPGKLTNGSSGNGTTGHLGGELFKSMTGVDIVHVPYKGSAQAINDLIGGQSTAATTSKTTAPTPNIARPRSSPGRAPMPRPPSEMPPLKCRSPGPKAIQSNVTAKLVRSSAPKSCTRRLRSGGSASSPPAKTKARAAGAYMKSSAAGAWRAVSAACVPMARVSNPMAAQAAPT